MSSPERKGRLAFTPEPPRLAVGVGGNGKGGGGGEFTSEPVALRLVEVLKNGLAEMTSAKMHSKHDD